MSEKKFDIYFEFNYSGLNLAAFNKISGKLEYYKEENYKSYLENYKELTKGFDIKGTLFMETGVDDSDYKKEAKFVKSLMDQTDSNMKGLIVSIRPEEEMVILSGSLLREYVIVPE